MKFSSKQFHNGYTGFNFARIVLSDGVIYEAEQKTGVTGIIFPALRINTERVKKMKTEIIFQQQYTNPNADT